MVDAEEVDVEEASTQEAEVDEEPELAEAETEDEVEAEEPEGEYDDLFNGLYVERQPSSTIEWDESHLPLPVGLLKPAKRQYFPTYGPSLSYTPVEDDEELEEQDAGLYSSQIYDFHELDEKIKMMTEKMMITQARFFLQFILVPYIRTTANKANRAPNAFLREYVRSNTPIRDLLALENFYSNPRVMMFQSLVKRYLPQSDDELKDPELIAWWLDRLIEVDPVLGDVIANEPNGKGWLSDSLAEITSFLKKRVI